MKKLILIVLFICLITNLFAADFQVEKVKEYKQGNFEKGLFLRNDNEIAPQDDFSKNYIVFDNEGKLFFYQADSKRFIKTDNYELAEQIKLDLLLSPYAIKSTKDCFVFNDFSGRIYKFNKEMLLQFYVETFDLLNTESSGLWLKDCYFDEQSNILFFRDNKERLYSIIQPGVEGQKNKKNFKTTEETLEIIREQKYENMEHLGLLKDKYLTLNGHVYYWAGQTINGVSYQIFDNEAVRIWSNESLEISCKDNSGIESIESIAIHPSGDIYILRMNWNTKTHNLYRMENTWNSQWREQWYKAHPKAE